MQRARVVSFLRSCCLVLLVFVLPSAVARYLMRVIMTDEEARVPAVVGLLLLLLAGMTALVVWGIRSSRSADKNPP